MKALPLHDMRGSPQHLEACRVAIAPEADVDAASPEPEVKQGDVGQPGRQLGIDEYAAAQARPGLATAQCSAYREEFWARAAEQPDLEEFAADAWDARDR